MTVAEFIRDLQKLPGGAEIGVLTATAHARPPVLARVQQYGWDGIVQTGFDDLSNAWLIRPANEVI